MATISKILVPNARERLVLALMANPNAKEALGDLTCRGDTCFTKTGKQVSDRELMNAWLFHDFELTESVRKATLDKLFGEEASPS